MKLRNLLLACACALATSAMAQATFPITLTTADGLPVQTSDAAKKFNGWTSSNYTFAQPVNGFRMTVTHCSWQDALSTSNNGSRGYVFFTMGEFYLYDSNGNKIELTAENFSSNAAEAAATGDGSGLAGLCDGDESTYFHTTYSTPEEGSPNPIGQEYYLEVTFPEPMTSFSFGFQKRSNNANIPSEIILTPLGVEANPFPEYEFQLGEQIEAEDVTMGEMYVLCDNGNVSAYEGTYLYPATNGVPGYNCIDGKNGYHLRRTPNVDCIFVPVAAGTDAEGNEYFYLRNYLTGRYVRNAVNWHEPCDNLADAAKLRFKTDELGKTLLVSSTEIYFATNSQASFVAYQDWSDARRPLYFYKATIATKFLYQDLQAVIADAEAQLAAKKDVYTEADATEDITKFQAAIAEAKTVAATATGVEINTAKAALESAAAEFLTVQIYLWIDEVAAILDTEEFGTNFGNYPIAQQKIMENLQQQLANDIDTRSFVDFTDVKNYLANVQKIMDDFYASKVTDYSVWPLHLVAEEGSTCFQPYDAHPSCYIYNSPTFFLEQEVERIYITFVSTNTGDAGGGWPCTNWAHFELYDGNGEKVDITARDITTNALEPSEGSIEGICDYDDDGNPDLTTYLHTLYSESKKETNEHYLCIEFPEPMNLFRFTLISRENGRLVPTEMEIGPEPYHYVAPASIGLRDMITSAADIDPNKFYLLKGNINVVDKGAAGSGFYSSATTAGENPQNEGAIQFIPTANEGEYNIYFPVHGYYLAQPTDWQGVSTTEYADEAAIWRVAESKNLQDAFKIYAIGPFGDDGFPYAMLQDWSGSLGYFTVNALYKEDFGEDEDGRCDDTDGEGDWTIYECDVPVYNVYAAAISQASQLNTNDQFAMWGNLEVVSKGGEGSGFYNAITLDGKSATNWNLFRLEDAGNGAYKIFFTAAQVYLKAPAGWAYMETTTDPAEAGAFLFKESENLKGAFKIYATGNWENEGTACPIAVLQDWGSEDNMGSYIIPDWASDDTDGESDWTIFVNGDPSEVVLNRADYLGSYIYTWDDYWTPTETKTFDPEVYLEADPESEDGVILTNFSSYGDLKGTFDGESHTITFPTEQVVKTTDQWYQTYMTTNGSDIVFTIDLVNNQIIFFGQAGVQNVALEAGLDNGGWHFLSKSWIKLVPVEIGDRIAPAITDAAVLSTVIYNMNGQVMDAPVQGINIVKTVYDNGTVLVQKILVK